MTNPIGAWFERKLADYFNRVLVGTYNRGIDRQVKTGRKDKGDLRGVYVHNEQVVVEAKHTNRVDLAGWVREAESERRNAGALAAVIIHKRRGYGETKMWGQYVTMTVADLVAIITGERPAEGEQ